MSADDEPTNGGSFIGRWSARKRTGATGTAPSPEPMTGQRSTPDSVFGPDPVAPLVAADSASAGNEGELASSDAQATVELVLSDADMPPIDSLDATSDLSDFFNSGVSAVLRRAALRHVFRSPRYNVRDGLNDYDGDYTVFEPLGDTVTADMKFHAARKERLAEEHEREEAERLAQAELDDADEPAGDGEHEEESHEEESHEVDSGADACGDESVAGENGSSERVDAGLTGSECSADTAPAAAAAQSDTPLQLADSAIVVEQEKDTDRS